MNENPAARVRNLIGSLSFLLLSALFSAFIVGATIRAGKEAERALQQAKVQLAESRNHLARAQEDEKEIRARIDRYRELIERGRTQPERRLDWVETLRSIKEKRRLLGMEYEIAPQRPLDPKRPVTGGYGFLVSPMKLEMQLLHENDLLGLLADLSAQVPALISVRQCTIERLPPSPQPQAAQLKASCEIDWITLQEKL
ncbi:MAG: hypothetical protein HXY29_06600 [Rhodocyclaceae bacterium]|jgi:hypothetical protein|nr:hypothetical protein [Rhodocyclaceae bacterium]